MPDGMNIPIGHLGIQLNADQQIALAEIETSIDNRRLHSLTGWAGSGKTTVIQVLAAKLHKDKRQIVVSAPTHKATHVAESKLRMAGINVPCCTVASLLGLKPVPKGDKLTFVRDRNADPIYADVIITDESSMLGHEIMNYIEEHLAGRSVVFVGDPAQLPPVGEPDSRSFATKHRSHLNTIVRQAAENPILVAASAIRLSQGGIPDWSWCKPANKAPLGVYVPRDAEAWMRKGFTSPEFDQDADTFRVLGWTNKFVNQTNAMIREWRYGKTKTPFVVGEKAVINGPLLKKRKVVLNTNDEVTIKMIEGTRYRGLATWAIVVETRDGTEIDGHLPKDEKEFQTSLVRLAENAKSGSGSWKAYHGFKQAFIQARPLYATTVHQSQGSTYRNCFVNIPEMKRWVRSNQPEGLRGLYVGATRPSHALICVGA